MAIRIAQGSFLRLVASPPFDFSRLAEALLHFHSEDARQAPASGGECRPDPARDVIGEELGRRIGDRQESTLLAGKAPVTVFVGHTNVRPFVVHLNSRAASREQHPVVKLIRDQASQVLESDEVDHVVILVELVLHLDRRPVIVAVEPLAVITVIGDEMASTEDEVVLGYSYFELGVAHVSFLRFAYNVIRRVPPLLDRFGGEQQDVDR
jgi:hypothetical protein